MLIVVVDGERSILVICWIAFGARCSSSGPIINDLNDQTAL